MKGVAEVWFKYFDLSLVTGSQVSELHVLHAGVDPSEASGATNQHGQYQCMPICICTIS